MPKLGVNIDHVATLRQQRHPSTLDLLLAAHYCESAGADSIVVHLREDRRHIQDADVRSLRKSVKTRLNLEMSVASGIVSLAGRFKPDQATLVPEKRQELTTEGGLDVFGMKKRVECAVERLKKHNIDVSLFIEPDIKQIRAAHQLGVNIVELHTGAYANSFDRRKIKGNLKKIREAVICGHELGLVVNSGHGLDYNNVCAIAAIPGMYELNIGYSIVCHAVYVGLKQAVKQMKALIDK
ncbi:MAG TPA: pyridoxine 5'-phosphate synthase [Candidatus Omnitrophica bacterium]|nr:pyridoxine 5'-phosphate synthase [Candidatus Omnitrophota bacterium]